jgi:hypothetical protein
MTITIVPEEELAQIAKAHQEWCDLEPGGRRAVFVNRQFVDMAFGSYNFAGRHFCSLYFCRVRPELC